MTTMTELPPLADEKSKILILGSEPGRTALLTGQYYAHHGNQFWMILYSVFGEKYTDDYEMRKDFILRHNLDLFDVLKSCKRPIESGGSIYDEEANNFDDFYRQYSNIKYVCFNGRLASDLYEDHIGWKKFKLEHMTLPSTSAGDKKKSLREKMKEWQNVKKWLDDSEKGDRLMYEI